MTSTGDETQVKAVVEALARGEMAELIRAYSWDSSPIGSVDTWSPSLRTMVTVLLANRFPLLLWWGPDHVQIYNDPYRPVLGTKHPYSLGQPARECWPEIWHIIGPLIEAPYTGGPPTWDDDLFLEVNRHGFVEETHFTVAYSPVPDDTAPNGICGVLATVHETTQQVVQERRLALLRDLSARSSDAKTAEEACIIAAGVLGNHAKDVPFALLYLSDSDGQSARLAAAAGAEGVGRVAESGDTPWPLTEVMQSNQSQAVENLVERLDPVPPGPWSDPPERALVLPIPSSAPHRPAGVLVLGLSPRLALDDSYRSFAALVAGQIGTAIVNARAYEEERKRAEALAELDRAKTAFFSNVSHEFRTPLTLLLGPLEEALALPAGTPAETARPSLESAHRNSLRLLRLVNTLLDFSRIEAGRAEATFEATDLAALTADLASVFRSAIERAGLCLIVDCPPLSEPVYVDRDMWEKIVLNLLSNALKFTFEGEIAISLRQIGEGITLEVRDTGTGIPPEEVPHIFERFHRVRTGRARTHEGTGIGLALVQELVALHGGSIHATSGVGSGTTISITIPLGKAHLPGGQIGAARTLSSTATGAAPYVEEALRWLPDDPDRPDEVDASAAGGQSADSVPTPTARLLIADDNADMRAYLRRLLESRYDVEVVANGGEVLASIRSQPPDLILTDVMMPGMDGFELLKTIRTEPHTSTLPVILLSARAGEESTAAGLRAGADDYLVKPFSADELLARVQAHVALGQIRRDALEAERRSQGYLAQLHQATAALSAAATVEDVADVIIHEGIEMLDARVGAVALLSDEGASFSIIRSVGYPPDLAALWSHFPADASTPIADAVLARELLILGSMEERRGRYPHLADVQPVSGEGSVAVIPLLVDNRPVGALGLVFETTREFTGEELDVMQALGALCAQALDRSRLYEAEARALHEAEEQRAHLEATLGQIADGVIVTDQTGRTTFINDIGRHLLGVDTVGVTLEEHAAVYGLRTTTGEPIAAADLPLARALHVRETVTDADVCFHRPDGTTIHVRISAAPIIAQYDTLIGAVATFRNITALRQLERAREEFLSSAAHDLRTPLTSIRGHAQLAQRRLDRLAVGKEGAPLLTDLARIISGTDAVLGLIGELVDMTQLEMGSDLDMRREPADLVAIASAAIAAQQTGTTIAITLEAPSELMAEVDAARVTRVFGNLLSNAVKFSPDGIGPITVRISRDGGQAVIAIADNGIGIPAADLPHVFDRFVRAQNVAGRIQGTGIGLASARGIVKQHGGMISVESVEGQGATFTVRLPLAAP